MFPACCRQRYDTTVVLHERVHAQLREFLLEGPRAHEKGLLVRDALREVSLEDPVLLREERLDVACKGSFVERQRSIALAE